MLLLLRRSTGRIGTPTVRFRRYTIRYVNLIFYNGLDVDNAAVQIEAPVPDGISLLPVERARMRGGCDWTIMPESVGRVRRERVCLTLIRRQRLHTIPRGIQEGATSGRSVATETI